jgi:hypothetical protein
MIMNVQSRSLVNVRERLRMIMNVHERSYVGRFTFGTFEWPKLYPYHKKIQRKENIAAFCRILISNIALLFVNITFNILSTFHYKIKALNKNDKDFSFWDNRKNNLDKLNQRRALKSWSKKGFTV